MLKKLRARLLGAVLAFSALSTVGVAAPATASTSQSASSLAVSQAQPETYTVDVAGVPFTGTSAREIWGACGTNSPADKLVRAFPRSGAPGVGGHRTCSAEPLVSVTGTSRTATWRTGRT